MAQKVQIILEDDIDGGEADETVAFALDGTAYEIDLASGNADKLRSVLGPYIDHSRKTSGGRGRKSSPSKSGSGSRTGDAKEVRAWAKENGIEVPDRGRIPAEVREKFDSAN